MRILSLDGGGYLALSSIAFLREMERHFSASCHSRFDMFCGTSAGSLLTMAIASGRTASEICDIYRESAPRVFRNRSSLVRRLRPVRLLWGSRYPAKPLIELAAQVFGENTLAELERRHKRVLVPAYCLTAGQPRVFKTDHPPRLTAHGNYRLADVAVASASAPTYFCPHRIQAPAGGFHEDFCDGAIFANHPSLLGYVEARSELGVPLPDLKILSISTPRRDLCEHESEKGPLRRLRRDRGLFSWLPVSLIDKMIDANSYIADEILKRMMAPCDGSNGLYVRITFNKPKGTGLDVVSSRATETLMAIGMKEAESMETRERLRPFFEREA